MTEITARLRIATGIVLCAICEASRLRDGLDNEGDARANPEAQRLSTPDEVKPSATLADEVSDLVLSLDGQGVDRTSVLQGDHSSSPLADDAGSHSVGDGSGAGDASATQAIEVTQDSLRRSLAFIQVDVDKAERIYLAAKANFADAAENLAHTKNKARAAEAALNDFINGGA